MAKQSGAITVTVGTELKKALYETAKEEDLTVSQMVRRLVRAGFESREAQK